MFHKYLQNTKCIYVLQLMFRMSRFNLCLCKLMGKSKNIQNWMYFILTFKATYRRRILCKLIDCLLLYHHYYI